MSYQVEFEFSPIYELVNSLELFVHKRGIKNVDLGVDWVKKVQENLDAASVELGDAKAIPCFNYLYLLIWQSPEKEDINKFLHWLQTLQPGNLYEKLFSYVSDPLPADLEKIRNQYVKLLKVWEEVYFSAFDLDILDILRESVMEWDDKREHEEDPVVFVEKVSGGLKVEPYEGLQQIIMTPTYHTSPLITTRKFKNIVHIQYPVDAPETAADQPSKKLLRLSKALGDDNRLRILKLVKEGPKTFTEILQHFNISKSTVHHHIMLLRTAGLISAYHTSECCSEAFVYRPLGMEELVDSFNAYLEK
ncbi:winged helix-turn-helix domain-containing protein [Bacillus sp. 31A1R]|uniref:Winged helix-turn-helix domain-containing protein n=1 Tax=Robertmurraya mangrovi TaxID=3098077 RepID=A0ABU5ITH7_9BACI|nr:winged helix-turn-helix domain-containing protein [Bacillus sp. 31A1R]MDZ5470449.1 winged helix-turn-helix domain-containing protein [Bacillus sp. 31A1R]